MSQQHDEDDGTVIRPPHTGAVEAFSAAPHAGPSAAASPQGTDDGLSLQIGARVSEFEILRRIGEGGFSIVYLAMDHSLERTVALKEYMPSSLAVRVGTTQVQPRSPRLRDTFELGLKSFVNEAKLLAQFDHPALVKVYRFWEANGTAYMAMPFYQGITLKDAVRAMPQPPDEAWLMTLLAPLTQALLVIHAERCYHRDIAPDNVILLAGSGRPLLLDFGAARRVIGDMTQGLTVILKAGYAPVEQYAEVPGMKQGPWTDVYALAAVVYWTITGSTPPASVARMMGDSFVPLATSAAGRYRAEFLQAIDRALVLMPGQRTQSIDAFRRDIGLAVESPSRPAPPPPADGAQVAAVPSSVEPVRQVTATFAPTAALAEAARSDLAEHVEPNPRRRYAVPVAAVATLGAAVAAGAIWWVAQGPGDATPPPAPRPTQVSAPAAGTTPNPSAAATPAIATPDNSAQGTPALASPVQLPPTAAPEPPNPVVETAPVRSEPAVEAPPPRLATKVPVAADATPREQTPVRDPPRRDPAKREAPTSEASNSAECGRIYQRLSLGESNPELLARLRSLKCR